MFSLSKEKILKNLAYLVLLLFGLTILFVSLVTAGLEMMMKNKIENNIRNSQIEYIKEMPNGEKLSKIYKVPECKVLPGEVKYIIKRIRDNLWISLSRTPKEKAEVYLLMADKRMYETVELIKLNKNEKLILKTLNEAFLKLKQAKNIYVEENMDDLEIIKIDQQISLSGLAYEDIVKSFNYKNEGINKIINEIENWNQKNNQKKTEL